MNGIRKRNSRALRFSLRSLLIATVVVGMYFACGPPTKERGVADVTKYQRANQLHEITPDYVAPLVLKCWVSTHSQANRATTIRTTYYVWFFGFVKLLPFERVEIEPDLIGGTSASLGPDPVLRFCEGLAIMAPQFLSLGDRNNRFSARRFW